MKPDTKEQFVRRVDLIRESAASHIFGAIDEERGETEANYRLDNGSPIGSAVRGFWFAPRPLWDEEQRRDLRERAAKAGVTAEEAVLDEDGCAVAGWLATGPGERVSLGLAGVDCLLRALQPRAAMPEYLERVRPASATSGADRRATAGQG